MCGGFASDTCDIDLQSKIAREKELRCLKVGDRVEPHPNPREDGGYLEIQESHDPERLSVIEAWSCPKCGAGFLWACVVIEGGFLKSVEPVDLTEEILSSVDYITSEALMLFSVEQVLEVKKLPPPKLIVELLKVEGTFLRC